MCRFIIVKRGEALTVMDEVDTEAAARKNAEEFAVGYPAASFEVYQRTGTVTIEPRAVWKGAKP